MKDEFIQSAVAIRRYPAGRVLLEAAIVAMIGLIFAVAANQISPRGLALGRNYFPTGTNRLVRIAAGSVPSGRTNGTNSATAAVFAAQQLAAQIRREGLQLLDGRQAVQLFHDSRLQQGIVFIDARDEQHYREGHIPGAYEFDPYHPEKYFPDVLPVCRTAEKIVVYCNGGDCDDSETAVLLLKEVGIPGQKLFVYAGGISEWTDNHLPIETGPRNSEDRRKLNQ